MRARIFLVCAALCAACIATGATGAEAQGRCAPASRDVATISGLPSHRSKPARPGERPKAARQNRQKMSHCECKPGAERKRDSAQPKRRAQP